VWVRYDGRVRKRVACVPRCYPGEWLTSLDEERHDAGDLVVVELRKRKNKVAF
jgi:hypothetical protein